MLTSFLAGCTGTDDTSTDTSTDATTTDSTNTVKIGLLSPQTGPIAVYADGFEDAAAVAITNLNAASDTTFELVVADSGCDATQAATSAQTLVDSGVVGIAGAACSGATLSAITVAKEAGVPMVSYASTSPAVTTADDGGNLFRVVPSDAQQAVALKDLIVNRTSANATVAVLYMTNDYGSGLADNFEAAWGSTLCNKAGYDPEALDASTLVAPVLADASNCDVVVAVSYATDGAAIVEELHTQGYGGHVFGADGVADANFGNEFSDKHALDDVIATQPRPGTTSAAKTAFETAYSAAGGNASGIYTHETYDAVRMIGLAYDMENGSNMKTHLKMVGTDFAGASGTHTFDANGDVPGSGYNACDFSITGTFDTLAVGFDCDQIWTATGGIADAASEAATGSGKIKIGLLSPQTGPIAVYADGFEDAAAVAIAKLNDWDTSDLQFELVVANSGCDATQAATGAQTLIDSGVVGIVGAACSGATLGAIAVAKEAGVPMVSYASTSPAVTTADDNDFLFRVVPSDAQQSVALKDVVVDAGMASPAVLYMTNDYGSGLADNFEAAWSGSLCTKAGYDPESFDASTLAGQVVAASCDSVVLVSYATDGAAIVEALAVEGFTGATFGADGVADLPFQEAFSDNSTLDGMVATKPRPAGTSDMGTYFTGAYANASGNTSGIYTHETFDAVIMIGQAAMMEDGANMKTHLKMVGNGFEGASGTHTFDSNGDVGGSGYSVCTFSYDAGTSTVSFACARKWDANGLSDVE